MMESQSLQLVQSAGKLTDQIVVHVARELENRGYEAITPSLLSFLSALECGINFGSEIARNLGVTRQMVAKTVKELCRLGYLRQEDGPGKQKKILFTKEGEQLISDARAILFELDDLLLQSGKRNIIKTIDMLGLLTASLEQVTNKK